MFFPFVSFCSSFTTIFAKITVVRSYRNPLSVVLKFFSLKITQTLFVLLAKVGDCTELKSFYVTQISVQQRD
jgi:hypothetical protein